MSKDLQEQSKYLSYLLRHKPEAAKLTLDKEGWCNIPELLANTKLTIEELEEIVRTDSKGRYSFEYWEMNGTREPIKIRANQGHSTSQVRITFNKAVPPVVLYHGTNEAAYYDIVKQGLKPMNRHHVHLTDDLDTAQTVGGRRKRGIVVLKIDAKQMLTDGFEFFRSENGVWLVDAVPAKYITQEL
jgi:putative RNA 2'-phosphotransferase